MIAAACAMLAGTAAAQGVERGSVGDAQARYEAERARCLSSVSQQDRQTCLREADAALGEARRGTLSNAPEPYAENALARCRLQPIELRDACVARMTGRATVSGSVEEGGLVREYREIIVGEPGETAATFAPPPRRVEPEPPVNATDVR